MKFNFNLSLLVVTCGVFSMNLNAQDIGVKSVNKSKKTVTIKSGKNDGLTKGSRVCFYNKSKKITCGKVRKVGKSAAIVKVRKSKVKKISTESVARLGMAKS